LNRAKHVAKILRAAFPVLEIYCPAEQDTFPQKAMELGLLSVDEVLRIDCEILCDHEVLLVFGAEDDMSDGMRAEVKYARENYIPVFFFSSFGDLSDLDRFLRQVIDNSAWPNPEGELCPM